MTKKIPYWKTAAGKESHRKSNLKRLYGITPARFQEMLEEQEGKCKICGRHYTEFEKPFIVDHSHVTNEVRALLCPACNTALGLMGDSPKILRRAASYIEKGGG